MSFRDDSDALRARIDNLETELAEARAKLELLENVEAERARLEARVAELEALLEKDDGSAKRKERERLKAQREKERAERESQRHATRSLRRGWTPQQWWLAGSIGVLVLGLAGWAGYRAFAPITIAPPTLGMVDLDASPYPTPIVGSVTGTEGAGFDCAGYVPAAPQIVLRSRETQLVRIAPSSQSGDLVLVIVTSDGRTLCDDDSVGRDPLITTSLPAGDTHVFIGTYSDGASADFSLLVVASASDVVPDASGLAVDAPPVLGRADIAAGETRDLSYAGSVSSAWAEADAVEANCRGYLPVAPHLVVQVQEESTFMLTATATEDLVMLVRGPNGLVRCDDDSGGSNWPRIAALVPPGEYRVWVGTYSSQAATAAVPFTLTGRVRGMGSRRQAADETQTLPSDGAPVTITGVAAGEITSLDLGAPPCAGLVPARAQVGLRIDAPHDVFVEVRTDERAAPVLIRHPDGAFECFSGASHATWQAGEHELFVGVADGVTPSQFTITAHAAAPSVQPWRP